MAYSKKASSKNADSSPYVDIVCHNVAYELSTSPVYDKIMDIATKEIRELYYQEQEEENQEILDMIANNEIDSADEYDRLYAGEFVVDSWKERIEERADRYLRNVIDLPTDVVVTIDRQLSDDESTIKSAIKERYGYDVKSVEHHGQANSSDILKQKTFDAITEMYKSDTYRRYLDLTANMNGYSINNTALVIAQKPNAEAVKGYNAWNEHGRNVGKGEKAIKIWCPLSKVLKTQDEVEKFLDRHPFDYGKKGDARYETEKKKLLDKVFGDGQATVLYGFSVGNVFDIYQTVPLDPNHDNLQELLDVLHLNKPLSQSLENCADIIDCIEKAMGAKPGSLVLDPDITEQENMYRIIENYAEEVLRTRPSSVVGIKHDVPLKGDAHNLESAMSAYLVASHMGINCDEKAALEMTKYMKNELSYDSIHTGRREVFTSAYTRATRFAKQFNNAFDKAYEPYLQKIEERNNQRISDIIKDTMQRIGKNMASQGVDTSNVNPHLLAPLITYSKLTAQEKGTQLEWNKSANENQKCAEDIASSLNKYSTPQQYGVNVDTAAALESVLREYPNDRVALVLAHEVYRNQASLDNPDRVDGRFSVKAREWAKNVLKQHGISDDAFGVFEGCCISDKTHTTIVDGLIKTATERLDKSDIDMSAPNIRKAGKHKTNDIDLD